LAPLLRPRRVDWSTLIDNGLMDHERTKRGTQMENAANYQSGTADQTPFATSRRSLDRRSRCGLSGPPRGPVMGQSLLRGEVAASLRHSARAAQPAADYHSLLPFLLARETCVCDRTNNSTGWGATRRTSVSEPDLLQLCRVPDLYPTKRPARGAPIAACT